MASPYVEMPIKKMTDTQGHKRALLGRGQLADAWVPSQWCACQGCYRPKPCSQSHKLRNKTGSILEWQTHIIQVLQSWFIKYQFSIRTGKGLNPGFLWPTKFSLCKQASGNQLIISMPVYSFKVRYIKAKGTGHEHPPASTSLWAKKCMWNQSIIQRWACSAPTSTVGQ